MNNDDNLKFADSMTKLSGSFTTGQRCRNVELYTF